MTYEQQQNQQHFQQQVQNHQQHQYVYHQQQQEPYPSQYGYQQQLQLHPQPLVQLEQHAPVFTQQQQQQQQQNVKDQLTNQNAHYQQPPLGYFPPPEPQSQQQLPTQQQQQALFSSEGALMPPPHLAPSSMQFAPPPVPTHHHAMAQQQHQQQQQPYSMQPPYQEISATNFQAAFPQPMQHDIQYQNQIHDSYTTSQHNVITPASELLAAPAYAQSNENTVSMSPTRQTIHQTTQHHQQPLQQHQSSTSPSSSHRSSLPQKPTQREASPHRLHPQQQQQQQHQQQQQQHQQQHQQHHQQQQQQHHQQQQHQQHQQQHHHQQHQQQQHQQHPRQTSISPQRSRETYNTLPSSTSVGHDKSRQNTSPGQHDDLLQLESERVSIDRSSLPTIRDDRRNHIDELAEYCSSRGHQCELDLFQQNRNNPHFAFLGDPSHPEYSYFKWKLEVLKQFNNSPRSRNAAVEFEAPHDTTRNNRGEHSHHINRDLSKYDTHQSSSTHINSPRHDRIRPSASQTNRPRLLPPPVVDERARHRDTRERPRRTYSEHPYDMRERVRESSPRSMYHNQRMSSLDNTSLMANSSASASLPPRSAMEEWRAVLAHLTPSKEVVRRAYNTAVQLVESNRLPTADIVSAMRLESRASTRFDAALALVYLCSEIVHENSTVPPCPSAHELLLQLLRSLALGTILNRAFRGHEPQKQVLTLEVIELWETRLLLDAGTIARLAAEMHSERSAAVEAAAALAEYNRSSERLRLEARHPSHQPPVSRYDSMSHPHANCDTPPHFRHRRDLSPREHLRAAAPRRRTPPPRASREPMRMRARTSSHMMADECMSAPNAISSSSSSSSSMHAMRGRPRPSLQQQQQQSHSGRPGGGKRGEHGWSELSSIINAAKHMRGSNRR